MIRRPDIQQIAPVFNAFPMSVYAVRRAIGADIEISGLDASLRQYGMRVTRWSCA